MPACPDEEAWLQFLDHEHSSPRDLDAHLASCHACRLLVGTLAGDGPSIDDDAAPTLPRRPEGAAETDRIGALVAGKWRIESLAGAGGMGRVYRARHHNGHEVAIKFLHHALATQPEVVRRFRREGYVANRVAHPAVVKVLDDGDDDGPFLVMELLQGMSCRAKVLEGGPLPPTEAMSIVEVAARAVAEAHRVEIVHRDIKPDNIFLSTTGDVRLLDFGLASVRSIASEESMTSEGVTMGTVGYMAPEQARGDNARVSARSDVWSLAATGIALMTGRPIHGGRTPAEQLAFAVTKKAPPARSLAPGLSPAIARVLDRALSFEPDDRYADAGAFADDLARARTGRPHTRRQVARWAVVAAPVIAVILALGSRASQKEPHALPSPTIAVDVPRPPPLPPMAVETVAAPTAVETVAPIETDASTAPPKSTSPPARSARTSSPRPLASTPTPPPTHETSSTPTAGAPSSSRDPLLPRF